MVQLENGQYIPISKITSGTKILIVDQECNLVSAEIEVYKHDSSKSYECYQISPEVSVSRHHIILSKEFILSNPVNELETKDVFLKSHYPYVGRFIGKLITTDSIYHLIPNVDPNKHFFKLGAYYSEFFKSGKLKILSLGFVKI